MKGGDIDRLNIFFLSHTFLSHKLAFHRLWLRSFAANFSRRSLIMPRIFLFLVLACISTSLFAQEAGWPPAPGHTALNIWPKGAPGAQPNPAPEIDTTTAKDHLVADRAVIRLGNVSTPTLTLYTPAGKNTGAAVVVFPEARIAFWPSTSKAPRSVTGSTRRASRAYCSSTACPIPGRIPSPRPHFKTPSVLSESCALTLASGTSIRTGSGSWASPRELTLRLHSAPTSTNVFTIRSMRPTRSAAGRTSP